MTSTSAPDATGQNGCVVPESANRSENVVAYRFWSSSCSRPNRRSNGNAGSPARGSGRDEILEAEHRDHRFDDDDRRHVLAEAGVPAPSVLQVVFARPVEDERIGFGDVSHRRAVRGEDQRARGDRPAVGDASRRRARTCEAALRPAAAAGALRGNICTGSRRLSSTRVPLSTLTASDWPRRSCRNGSPPTPLVRYSPACSRMSESITRHVASSWPAIAPTMVPITFSAIRRSLTRRGSRLAGRATVGVERPS